MMKKSIYQIKIENKIFSKMVKFFQMWVLAKFQNSKIKKFGKKRIKDK